MTERRYQPQKTARVRAGTANATGARSYSIAVPPAIAEAIPPGQLFWADYNLDGSITFRPVGRVETPVVPHAETKPAAKIPGKKK